ITTVKEGDTLGLGRHTLRFMAAPMVHWPEVMVSWLESERVLFSADAFGKFGAIQYADDWAPEAARYYINIVGKYGPQVQALLKKVAPLDVAVVAPLHGPVLRGHEISRAVDLYQHWSTYSPTRRGVLVAYASIYGGTRRTALALAAELRRLGAGEVYTADLTSTDQSEAIARAFQYDAMVVAAPTYDAGLYPAMHDFLYHLGIKNYRNRTVAIIENGSWAPMAGRKMSEMLQALPGITILDEMITIRSAPDAATADAILRMATALAERPDTGK
ncbi:MAG: FprA family A-type flavoprotein, partial [Paramuribaculum sp.]|nr:FprA family A-type flavoprotein [Paramuribaculum sp.]